MVTSHGDGVAVFVVLTRVAEGEALGAPSEQAPADLERRPRLKGRAAPVGEHRVAHGDRRGQVDGAPGGSDVDGAALGQVARQPGSTAQRVASDAGPL